MNRHFTKVPVFYTENLFSSFFCHSNNKEMHEKGDKYMFNYERFNETVLKEVEKECRKYNYHAELRFDEIHIQTKFESWYFVPNENGIIKLMHGNTVGHVSEKFHKQFSRKMSYKDMIQYIHEHETAKYTNNVFVFTFTKTGGVNMYA